MGRLEDGGEIKGIYNVGMGFLFEIFGNYSDGMMRINKKIVKMDTFCIINFSQLYEQTSID